MKQIIFKNNFIRFIVIFLGAFLICYYSIQFITGAAVKGGVYSTLVENYFDIASWLRTSLILSAKLFLSLLNFPTVRVDDFVLMAVNGRGVRIVYACLGFAVMSVWVAFIIASTTSLKKKIIWLLIGLLSIWVLNVSRISLVLLAANKGWHFPFGLDHHTWFNIIVYSFIFLLIFLFEKNIKSNRI
jgi:exosortase/archaeosortase family protein